MRGAQSLALCSAFVALGGCVSGGVAGGRSSSGDDAAAGSASDDAPSAADAAGRVGADAPAAIEEDAAATLDGADSAVILDVTPNDGAPLDGVASLVVTIQQDGAERTVTFAHAPTAPIDDPPGVQLTVDVTAPESGAAIFSVEARTATGCALAKGLATVSIATASTVHADVALARLGGCAAADAGAPNEGSASDGGESFPGCDPVTPDCLDGTTCRVSCAAHAAACTASGDGFHGATCANDADCSPGTQCLDYAGAGCAVKICRHFCAGEANCPQPVSLALPRNVCAAPLACAGAAGPADVCTVACDPTASAAANGSTACADGLACVLVDASHADCACPAKTRTRSDGAACATDDDCAPDFVCDGAGAARACRALCHCYADSGACAAGDGDCPSAATRCAPMAEGGVFGACRP
jgi:hypothetical protein